jgi:benzoate membrane transport protein
VSPATSQPLLAGIVTAVVGFASSATIVLAGLTGVGASPAQAASGLLVLCATTGIAGIALGLRTRMPISIAWSTPGAALLAATGPVAGGWPAAVGAFVVAGALAVVAGAWRPLTRALTAIPAALASAMLAGVLLPLCVAPAAAVVDLPALAGPVVLAWAALLVLRRRWAVPGALVVAIGALLVDGSAPALSSDLLPAVVLTAPDWRWEAVAGLALPLFVVTMASQNVPGAGVLASFGYRPDLRPVLMATGALSAAGAPLGGHAINLAAITAALAAGDRKSVV